MENPNAIHQIAPILTRNPARLLKKSVTFATTGDEPLFRIGTGHIKVVQLVGIVTTQIDNDSAHNAQFITDPSQGSETAICNAANLQNKPVGTLATIAGDDFTTAIQYHANDLVAAGDTAAPQTPIILPPGYLDFRVNFEIDSGAMDFYLLYEPVEDGAKAEVAWHGNPDHRRGPVGVRHRIENRLFNQDDLPVHDFGGRGAYFRNRWSRHDRDTDAGEQRETPAGSDGRIEH